MTTDSADAMQWLSRTIAILVIMVLPCYLGSLLDEWLGTKYWAVIGICGGMLLTITTFVVMANKMIPPAGGTALSDEEFDGESDDQDSEPNKEQV